RAAAAPARRKSRSKCCLRSGRAGVDPGAPVALGAGSFRSDHMDKWIKGSVVLLVVGCGGATGGNGGNNPFGDFAVAAGDLAGVTPPDLAGTPPPDLTGAPEVDLAGTPPSDLAGTPPPDLASTPPADIAMAPPD